MQCERVTCCTLLAIRRDHGHVAKLRRCANEYIESGGEYAVVVAAKDLHRVFM
jgi:hypothetical protein